MVRAATLLLPILLAAGPLAAREGDDLVGSRPSEWRVEHWLDSEPLTLEELRGRVVLVRFWTAPHCPYCRASAPALNDFHDRYAERGLTVIGLYHHQGRGGVDGADVDEVARWADELGFEFPVAIDAGWRTLRALWLDGHPRGWNRVSFLLDRQGVIRRVHPGGQYVQGDAEHAALEARHRAAAGGAGRAIGRRPELACSGR
ncbi:MAG TPA: TlpA disulfide reductase family protein [Thermoanaerobaculia bacterium]|nr:TlpA disulfide reductase family protein [Thermoanaerobaculia bacterium]